MPSVTLCGPYDGTIGLTYGPGESAKLAHEIAELISSAVLYGKAQATASGGGLCADQSVALAVPGAPRAIDLIYPDCSILLVFGEGGVVVYGGENRNSVFDKHTR